MDPLLWEMFERILVPVRRVTRRLEVEVLAHIPRGDGPIIYFAHSMRDYGTAREAEAEALIRQARPGCRLANPKTWGPLWKRLERELDVESVYVLVLSIVDEVVALEHEGHVGRGVYHELFFAGKRGLPRSVVRGGSLVDVHAINIVDRNDYRVRFGRVVTAQDVLAHGA